MSQPQRNARVSRDWETSRRIPERGKGVRVAVIDSGWDHTESEPRVLNGAAFVGEHDDYALGVGADTQDRIGHGTACIDIILGLAPDCVVVPLRVFGRVLETSPEVIVAALTSRLAQTCHVLNVSLGTTRSDFVTEMYDACERLRRRGAVVVAAAGGNDLRVFPASFDNVLTVGADSFSDPWEFRWNANGFPECVANGGIQMARSLRGEYRSSAGSSLAAAHVSGLIACLYERHPAATPEEIRTHLSRWATS